MDSTTCAQFTLIALPALYLPGISLSQQAILQSPKQLCASPLRGWALSYASPSMRLRKTHSPSCVDELFKEELEKITQISHFFFSVMTRFQPQWLRMGRLLPERIQPSPNILNHPKQKSILPEQNQPLVNLTINHFSDLASLGLNLKISSGTEKL